ncbi:Asp23/Gls24 family envelope stress response protein [Thermosediminibacter litoriperuensis]|uniref:Cell envelope-related Asp23 family protein n=1 Tax=Thermosediminibacter litoriperuensis TaxID=291989 RepID=A0A5S5AUR9_9FIRM|nr:Asp23/Gls24 family envelope stress response protein [Thermosediminibacter litoriperuensis]TYP56191.1 cell envelope-related Asp23 family protein [Thermosediminibacter litoriperuensis]
MEGRTNISENVFIEVAREAMNKVEDVFREERKGALSGLTKIFAERFAPQITVRKSEPAEGEEGLGSVSFEVKLSVAYGVKIPEVAQKVREKIISEVEALTGYKVEKVDIVIDRIVKPEELQEEKKEKTS